MAGPGTLEGLASAWEGKRDVAALLIVEMSCAGNLAVGRCFVSHTNLFVVFVVFVVFMVSYLIDFPIEEWYILHTY